VLHKLLFTLSCLVVPVAWGVVVNWTFNLWRSRSERSAQHDEPVFPDYQI
jgi:hypothetical protein